MSTSQRAAIQRGVRQARIRALRRKTRESERGPAALARGLADFAVKHAIVPSTGGGPTLLVGRQRRRGSSRVATALSPPPVNVRTSPIATAITRDLVGLGTAPFVGGYEIGAGLLEAATGRPHRIERLGKGALTGIKESAPVQLATGHPRGALRAVEQHPIFSLLDFAGAASIAGRIPGAAIRAAGKPGAAGARGRLADIGSTSRAPLALTRDLAGGVVDRRYSKNIITKGAQVLADRGRKPLTEEGQVVTVRRGRRDVPVLQPRTELGRKHLANRRGDFVAGRANAVERLRRDQVGAERTTSGTAGAAVRNTRAQVLGGERVTGVKGHRARDVVSLVTQGAITSAAHMRRDLKAWADRLDREHAARIDDQGFRHSGEAKLNRENAKMARAILASPKAMLQAERIVAEGIRHARGLNAADAEKAALGIDEAARLRRAALEVPALEHMGARHFTVEEHRRMELAALRHEQALHDELHGMSGGKAGVRPGGTERLRLQRELAAAREHRIAVSGRPPEQVKAHEAARERHAAAREVHRHAREAEDRAVAKVKALAGAHRSERGRNVMTRGPVAAYHVGARRFVTRSEAEKFARDSGGKVERIATTAREAKRVGELSNARRALAAAKVRRREAAKAERQAAFELKRHPLPPAREAIRYGENVPAEVRAVLGPRRAGQQLPNEDIEAFLRSRGRDPATVAYLPHKGEAIGARAYHKQLRMGTRASDRPEVRTGSAWAKGAVKSTARVLRDHGVHQAVQINHARQIDRVIAEHAMVHPAVKKAARGEKLSKYEQDVVEKGGGFTSREAVEIADRAMHDNGEYLVAVRLHPVVSEGTRRVIRENQQGPGGMESLGQRLLNDRVVTDGETRGARNVGLMSGHLYERQNAHLKPSGPLLRAAQVLNRAFRLAVLPQPRWLTGNFVEPYIFRLTPHGSGVNIFGLGLDIAKHRQLLRRAKRSGDPRIREAALELEAQGLGGLFVGQRGATNRRGLEDFPTLDATTRRLYSAIVAKSPAVETFGDITRRMVAGGGRAILAPLKAFFVANRGIERGAQHAGRGHLLRDDIQELTGSWLQTIRTGEEAWNDAQKGLLDTPAQHRLLDQAHEILGKYESWSPFMRGLVQGPAPFLPWMLNAARFVFWTMPAHHPALTSFLVKVEQVFNKDWTEQHKSLPPGSLKYAISNGKGGWIDLARYGPYGATIPALAGTGLRDFKKQFYPQFGGVSAAVSGQDPFGRSLKTSPESGDHTGTPTTAQELGIAMNQAVEALVPYVSTIRRLQEHGGTAYADSTVFSPKVKPGTAQMSAVRRVFDPFRPTYLGPMARPGEVSQAPQSRRDVLLGRRAALHAAGAAAQSRRDELLRRRAELLAP